VEITFDPAKYAWTLENRGLDFNDAKQVFAGTKFTFEDTRQDYGERRFVTVGYLNGRRVIVGWTPRFKDGAPVWHVFSMRRANEREIRRFEERLR
jgi:hypothetical protein